MPPRTVLYYTDSTAFGGAEVMLLTLLEGLDRTKWDPVLLEHGGDGTAPLRRGARDAGARLQTISPERKGGMRRAIRLAVAEERAAVFHAHLAWPLRCGLGLAAARSAAVPAVVATQHLFAPISSARALLRQRLAARGVHRYVAVSQAVARGLGGVPYFPAGKIEVIRNGIRLAAPLAPDPAIRARLAGDAGSPIVLTLARLVPQKGLVDLVRAARLVPGAIFAIAGDGPERERLETEARAAGVEDRVRLLGYRADVADLLAACDVFVLPSHFEGLPLAVLEAMAASRPVVATEVGGTVEAIRDGETGLLVPPQSPQSLAQAIGRVLQDADLARRLARSGGEFVRAEFSAERMVRETAALYDRLLAATEAAA
jgi:glycosyltransferase involved in cell wall biosynthesis